MVAQEEMSWDHWSHIASPSPPHRAEVWERSGCNDYHVAVVKKNAPLLVCISINQSQSSGVILSPDAATMVF